MHEGIGCELAVLCISNTKGNDFIKDMQANNENIAEGELWSYFCI